MNRKLPRLLAYLLILLLMAAAGATALLTGTEPGRVRLAGIVSKLASSPDRTIEIGRISGLLNGRLRLREVVVRDRDGPWLTLRGVEVDWSPLALFGRTFSAERVSVASVELARMPAPGQAPPAPPPDGKFSLPLAIELGAIALPRIALAEPVAGAAATLSATGTATLSDAPLRIVGRFGIERTDGSPARLDADIDFAPDHDRLTLALSGSEPEGGVLAGLLRLAGSPAVEIALSGEGPLADWRAKGALTVAGKVVTTLSASHREGAEGRRIAVNGEGNFAPFLPADLAVLAAGSAMFDVAAVVSPSGGVAVEHAVLVTDSISAEAAGTLDPAGASDLTLEARAQDDPVVLALGGEEEPIVVAFRHARVGLRGPGAAPAVTAHAQLALAQAAGLGVAEVAASLSSDGFDLARRAGGFVADVRAAGVGATDPALAPYVAGPLEARMEGRLEGRRLIVSSGMLRNRQLGAGFAGEADLDALSATVDLKAELRSRVLPAAARGALGDAVALSGRVTRGADGSLDVSGLSLASGPLSARGSATLADGRVEARLTGAHSDISTLAPQARGSVAFTARASGSVPQPEVEVTLTSDRVESAGRAITGLALGATGRVDPANPAAEVTLKGAVEGEAIEGRATLRSANGASRVEELSVSVGRNRISGALDLDEAFTPSGTITLDLPDLGPLAAMALEEMSGALAATVVFRAGPTPEIVVSASADRFERGDLSGRDVAIAATVSDYRQAPAIAGRVRAAAVRSGDTAISGIDVTLAREGAWTRFSGGATVAGIPASAEGRVLVSGGETTLELGSAKGAFKGVAAALARPATITARHGTVRLQDLALAVSGGTAAISGTAGALLDLDVRLSGVQAGVVNAFAPGLAASGAVAGTVKVTGPASGPQVAYDVDWRGAATAQSREAGFGPLDVASRGTFGGDRLAFTATVADGAGLSLRGGGTVALAGAVALDLKLDGTVPFSFLTRRLAEQGLSLAGGAELSLEVSGPAVAPAISGSVKSSGARFVDANSGLAVNDLSADIALGGGTATIRSVRGTLSTGGSLAANGTVEIDPARGFPADLTIRVADGRYTDGRVVTANFGGEMKVTGPLAGAPLLSGRVALGRTVITVPDRLPPSLATLAIKHRNAPASVAAQAEAMRPAQASGGQGGLALDVAVDAPQQIFIQGRGIDAEFGGSIRLTGPAAAPVAIGQFSMRRGRLSILGKRLDFTRGTLGFQGSLIPRLDFAADTPASDATATVTVSGEANNPRFGFTSSPSLPEDEVLARLIFGRSLSNLSPLQIAQLASAAAQLAGIGGSTSLLDRLSDQIGVDDIDVKTDEATGRTSVAVGKYLNDRTYVGIEKGEGAGSGKARIDLSIGRGVKLRGEASDDGKAKGGIFFEREY